MIDSFILRNLFPDFHYFGKRENSYIIKWNDCFNGRILRDASFETLDENVLGWSSVDANWKNRSQSKHECCYYFFQKTSRYPSQTTLDKQGSTHKDLSQDLISSLAPKHAVRYTIAYHNMQPRVCDKRQYLSPVKF